MMTATVVTIPGNATLNLVAGISQGVLVGKYSISINVELKVEHVMEDDKSCGVIKSMHSSR